MDDKEMRAKNVLERFGFNFKEEYRKEIRLLLEEEFHNYQLQERFGTARP